VQRDLKFGAYIGMPWQKPGKLREFVRSENGQMVVKQACVECGELTEELIMCRDCQQNSEWTR
jgi:hypothetical protein